MPKRVLVVSDDESVRNEATYAFPLDVEVTLATDARDGLVHLRQRLPSVVVVDMQTGSAGGFAMVRQMRMDPRFAPLPVMMLVERAQDAWIAKKAGANDIRTKPVTSGELARSALALID